MFQSATLISQSENFETETNCKMPLALNTCPYDEVTRKSIKNANINSKYIHNISNRFVHSKTEVLFSLKNEQTNMYK